MQTAFVCLTRDSKFRKPSNDSKLMKNIRLDIMQSYTSHPTTTSTTKSPFASWIFQGFSRRSFDSFHRPKVSISQSLRQLEFELCTKEHKKSTSEHIKNLSDYSVKETLKGCVIALISSLMKLLRHFWIVTATMFPRFLIPRRQFRHHHLVN